MIGYIYEIRNLKNNKIYLGSTVGLRERMRAHFNMLKNNKHHSDHLQNSYNKYGIDSFKFNKLETIKIENRDELFSIEAEYIKKWKLTDRNYGYNVSIPTEKGGAVNERLFKPVISISSDGKTVINHDSIADAGRMFEIRTSAICDSMKSHEGRYKNIRFVHLEDYSTKKDYSFKPYNRAAKRRGKSINKYSIDGVLIKTYDKLEEAAIDCRVNVSSISGALIGRQMVSAGFRWAYEGDELAVVDRNKITRNNSYMKKFILQMDLDGNIINELNPKDLPNEFKIKGVRKCIYGETTKYKGFKWEYKN